MNKLIAILFICSIPLIAKSQVDTIYHSNGNIAEVGELSNELKTGKWTSYFDNGSIECEGKYKADHKKGKWIWYYDNGNIRSIEKYRYGNYTKGEFWTIEGKPSTVDEVMVNPQYPGGVDALLSMLSENVTYPDAAEEKAIQGRVYVKFVISKEGDVEDIKTLRGVHPLLNEEALRVVRLFPKWTPGTFHGQLVRVSHSLPINLTLR